MLCLPYSVLTAIFLFLRHLDFLYFVIHLSESCLTLCITHILFTFTALFYHHYYSKDCMTNKVDCIPQVGQCIFLLFLLYVLSM